MVVPQVPIRAMSGRLAPRCPKKGGQSSLYKRETSILTFPVEFKDRTVECKEGEMIVVKKGEQHRPFAFEECKILIVEPRGVINTGESVGDLTFENNDWI